MLNKLPRKQILILFILIILAGGLIYFDLPIKPYSKFSTSYQDFEKGKFPKAAPTELPEKTVEVVGTIYGFDVDDNNTMIALATSKGVIVYDMSSFKVITDFPIANGVQAISFSPDGKKLAVLQKNTFLDYAYMQVTIFETTNWQLLHAYQNEHADYIYSDSNQIVWNPDNERLAFGIPNQGLVIWDPEREGEDQIISDSLYLFGMFDWSANGTRLIFNDPQGQGLRRLRVDTTDWVRLYDADLQSYYQIHWSPNGKYIATGHDGGRVCIWNTGNNQCQGVIRAHVLFVDGLAWSPDSKQIATSSGAIRIWDVKNGEEKFAFGYVAGTNGYADIIYSQLEWTEEKTVATLETSYAENVSA